MGLGESGPGLFRDIAVMTGRVPFSLVHTSLRNVVSNLVIGVAQEISWLYNYLVRPFYFCCFYWGVSVVL